ncbi:Altered inheritance of mitochondria protein 6 [Malassezia pachydermatis]|uniref:Altered inheritance of mitochondria protein 6 n=1 Tax=Malassezia pachydermatis TaxID=77020 RepID=A0A0M8MSU2_9BASI|nr:hypothetical protein Malapachy_3516 [Malassezia pachydermatis]KOS16057.1 hypothetical protein Malapachy_3516 [Malassezia pachydermatis]
MLALLPVLGTAFAAAVAMAADPIKANRTVLFHSHNDYVHQRSVYDAFDHDVYSYEADCWWNEEAQKFYVAHTAVSIDPSKTLQTQTLDRVLKIMEGKYSDKYKSSDPDTFLKDPANKPTSSPDWYKYYSEGFGGVRPLQVVIEIKSGDGGSSWKHIVEALEPFRQRGWLTKFENGKIHYGPLIVVGTGGTPFNQMISQSKRDYFYDCPLGSLDSNSQYSSTICPIASRSYVDVPESNLGLTPPPPKSVIHYHDMIAQAHQYQTTARFYGILPANAAKYDDFNMLLQQGADWLNIDWFEDAEAYGA